MCQKHCLILSLWLNFRMYGNLILYLMRYTFRMIDLFLASAGQTSGQHLTQLIIQGMMANLDLVRLNVYKLDSDEFDIKDNT